MKPTLADLWEMAVVLAGLTIIVHTAERLGYREGHQAGYREATYDLYQSGHFAQDAPTEAVLTF